MFWLPSRAPSVVVLGPSPAAVRGPTSAEPTAATIMRRDAGDGRHLVLLDRTQLLLTEPNAPGPLAAHVPIGGSPRRAIAATNFGRALAGRPPVRDSLLSNAKLRRWGLALRAFDAWSEKDSLADTAAGLFGGIPGGLEWKTGDLRSRVRRLRDDGRAMVRGGYLKLLQ